MASYSVTDLGAYSRRSSDIGAAINVRGDFVVSSDQSASPQGTGPAFRIGAGASHFLGVVGLDAYSEAFAINNAGVAVGASSTGDVSRAVSWRNGVVSQLALPSGATSSAALGVNNPGEIVGYVVVSNVSVASIWIAGDWFPIGTLAGVDRHGSIARAINNRGDIVGVAYTAQGGHAFLLRDNGTGVDLGTLGGSWSDAKSINDKGQVAGVSGVRATDVEHAFLWSEAAGGMSDLGTLAGGQRSYALGINNRSDVVGFSDTSDHRFAAVLWKGKQCNDLTAQVPVGWSLAEALAVNDSGAVICRGAGRMLLLRPN